MQTSDVSKIFCRINKSKIIFLIDIDFEKKKKKKNNLFVLFFFLKKKKKKKQ